jgi:hypothetical protein
MHVAAAEGRLLAGGVGYLQLEAALENKDNVRANELYWQLLGHGAALYGTDASVFTALGNVAQPGLPLALPAPAAGDSGTKPLKRVRVMAREVAEQSDSEDESDSDSEDSAVKKQKKHVEDEEDEESSEEDDSDSDDDPDNTARCKGKQPMTGVQKAAMKKQEDKGSSSEDDSESDDDPDNTARCKGKQPMTGLQTRGVRPLGMWTLMRTRRSPNPLRRGPSVASTRWSHRPRMTMATSSRFPTPMMRKTRTTMRRETRTDRRAQAPTAPTTKIESRLLIAHNKTGEWPKSRHLRPRTNNTKYGEHPVRRAPLH